MGLLTMLVALTINALVAVGIAPSVTADPPKPLRHFLVYKRSGGFAPSTRGLIVSEAGVASVRDSSVGSGRQTAGFQLGRREAVSLSRRVRHLHLGSIEVDEGEYCADCFVYSIASEGERVEFNESQIPPRLRGLIGEAEAIISAHTTPPDARADRG